MPPETPRAPDNTNGAVLENDPCEFTPLAHRPQSPLAPYPTFVRVCDRRPSEALLGIEGGCPQIRLFRIIQG